MIKNVLFVVPLDEKAWHVIYDTPTDNYYFGDDANDAAFGGELCYLKMIERTLKALDNFARVYAVLCPSWNIDHYNKAPGHQDIQDDKRDPGNALEACGYGRDEIDVIDNLVQRYIDSEDVDTETIVNQPEEQDEIIEKKPVGCTRKKYGQKMLIIKVRLNTMLHYVNVPEVALITLVLQKKLMYLKRYRSLYF